MIFFALLMAYVDVVNNNTAKNLPQLQTVQKLTLGDGSKEDVFFSEGVSVVASKERIFVLDPSNFRIVTFDRKGTMLKEFGKQGEGPGEFQGITALALDRKGNLAVFDSLQKRMTIFSPDGEYLRDVKMEVGIQHVDSPHFLENGHVIFMAVKTDAQFQMTYDFSIYDEEMAVVKKLQSRPLPPSDWSQSGDPNFWVGFLKDQFEAITNGFPIGSAISNTNLFVAGISSQYAGEIFTLDGQQQGKFTKKFQPKGFSPDAKFQYCEKVWEGLTANAFLAPNLTRPVFEKAYKKAELPDYVQPISYFINLGAGFAALSNYDVVKQQGILDYFDASGHLKASGVYRGPAVNMFGSGDKIYAVGANDEDSIVVHVYQVNGLP